MRLFRVNNVDYRISLISEESMNKIWEALKDKGLNDITGYPAYYDSKGRYCPTPVEGCVIMDEYFRPLTISGSE